MRAEHRITVTMDGDGNIQADSHVHGEDITREQLQRLAVATLLEVSRALPPLFGLTEENATESLTIEPDDQRATDD